MLPAVPSLLFPETGLEVTVAQTAFNEVKAEDYQPISNSKNIEKFINDYFRDIPILADIARCESRYRHVDKDGSVLEGQQNSQDRGVMQINLSYHGQVAKKLGLDLHNLDDNVAYARYLYEKEGAKPWLSSSACWAKFTRNEIARS